MKAKVATICELRRVISRENNLERYGEINEQNFFNIFFNKSNQIKGLLLEATKFIKQQPNHYGKRGFGKNQTQIYMYEH